MANPKRRHSKSRTRKKRAHIKAGSKQGYTDSSSGSEHQMHRIDPKTGMYRGRQVISITSKESKSKSK